MSRTLNTMPGWPQVAARRGVRLPRDWREPILDPVDVGARRCWGSHPGLWARHLQLTELIGANPVRAWYGNGAFGGKRHRIGLLVSIENRRMRHSDKQAIRRGEYDAAPPRPRHRRAHWDQI